MPGKPNLPSDALVIGTLGKSLKGMGPYCPECNRALFETEIEDEQWLSTLVEDEFPIGEVYYCFKCKSLFMDTGDRCRHCGHSVLEDLGDAGKFYITNFKSRILYFSEGNKDRRRYSSLAPGQVQARIAGVLKDEYPNAVGIRTLAERIGVSRKKIQDALKVMRKSPRIESTRKGSRWVP